MKLKNKQIAMFIEQMYEDIEFWYPYIRMQEEGAKVTVIAPEAKEYKGKNGLAGKADIMAKNADPSHFDALIIPGGFSPDYMRRDENMIRFVKKMNIDGKVIAAICHAPWVLASAGALKGRKVTSYFSLKDDLINAGAEWKDEEVVHDENIITSRNPNDLPAFCKTIIKTLSE